MARGTDSLSVAQTRCVALAAQGFASSPPPQSTVTQRHVKSVFSRVGVIQIDSVNVLVRSQELPLFARLGPHDRSLIPRVAQQGKIFEYWAHEASHVPVELHHLFRWRMQAARDGRSSAWGLTSMYQSKRKYVDGILRQVMQDGPVMASDLSVRTSPKSTWWEWDDAKRALEYLFWTGQLTARRRKSDFARIYDIPERVLPAKVLQTPTPSEREARKQLVVLAARSMGVATLADLADYYRQRTSDIHSLVSELVEDRELQPVTVESWTEPAYLARGAKMPEHLSATALLSPFDSLVWFRPRVERLFDFHYRIEIYTPKPQRRFGYYVLPVLVGDALVGRIDLKADRAAGVLLVQGAYHEPKVRSANVATAITPELRSMASWLGLKRIAVSRRGNLAAALAKMTKSK